MVSAIESKTKVGGTAESETVRVYTNEGRTVRLVTAEVGGRPLVIYTDAPAAVTGGLIDVATIRLTDMVPSKTP